MENAKQRGWFYLALMAAILSWSSFAIAAPNVVMPPGGSGGGLDLTPAQGDMSIAMLKMIFGDVVTGGTDAGMLGGMFAVLNYGALVFGGAMVTFMSVIATASTAHDGQLLGKKWSSMWVPIRTVFATSLLVPSGTGLCAIQAIVLYFVTQGVGLANHSYKAYLSTTKDNVMNLASSGYIKDLRGLSKSIYDASACVATMNQVQKTSGQAETYQIVAVDVGDHRAIQFGNGDPVGGIGSPTVCGEVQYKTAKPQNLTPMSAISAVSSFVLPDPAIGKVSDQLGEAHVKAALQMALEYRKLAAQVAEATVVADDPSGGSQTQTAPMPSVATIASGMANAEQRYRDSIKNSAGGQAYQSLVSGDMNVWMKKSEDDGWVSAGGIYYAAARVNNSFNVALDGTPHVTGPGIASLLPEQYSAMYSAGMAGNAAIAESAAKADGRPVVELADIQSGNIAGKVAQIFNKSMGEVPIDPFGSMAAVGVGAAGSKYDKNPIIEIKNTGDRLMGTVEAAYLLYLQVGTQIAAASGVAGGNLIGKAIGLGDGISNALNFLIPNISPLIMLIVGALFVLGAYMSVIVPMVPFILFSTGVLGWMIVVIEAMIAAPLWIAMHMHPEGDGIAGQYGGSGYMLMLEVFMRPTMMVFGMISASVLVYPAVYIVNAFFLDYMMSMQVESITGLVSRVFFMAIYVSLISTMIYHSFRLIHIVPEKVMEWIGGHARPDNPEGAKEEAKHVFAGVVQQVKGATGAAVATAGRDKAKREQERKQQAAIVPR